MIAIHKSSIKDFYNEAMPAKEIIYFLFYSEATNFAAMYKSYIAITTYNQYGRIIRYTAYLGEHMETTEEKKLREKAERIKVEIEEKYMKGYFFKDGIIADKPLIC